MNSKHAFWQALVFTILVFVLGIFLGFFLENSRSNKIESNLFSSEINLLDEQLRGRVGTDLDVNCGLVVKSTFDFADQIYWEAVNLEDYGEASKFGDNLETIHKRYDLLRTMLWLESINLKNKCGKEFHTVVYFYNYNIQDLEVNAKQNFYERMLQDLKDKYPEQVLLIPIAGNLDLASVDLALKEHEIAELPAILIDENNTVNDIVTFEELENVIFGNNN